jgi:hypothetical protein
MMTSEFEPPRPPFKWRKLLLQLVVGLICGALFGYGVGHFLGDYAKARGLEHVPLSVEIAGLIAVIYILIAAIVLAGSSAPSLGSQILNVEDADEVREMQSQFVTSGIAMLLWGCALLALALAEPVGPLAAQVALTIGAAGLIIGTWFAVKAYRHCDELMLAMNLEAGAITYGLVLVTLGSWAMLAHLDYAPAPTPLDILSACYALVMVASFIAIGRRGLVNVP